MTDTEYTNSIVDEWLADSEMVPFRVYAAVRTRAMVAEEKAADLQRQLSSLAAAMLRCLSCRCTPGYQACSAALALVVAKQPATMHQP